MSSNVIKRAQFSCQRDVYSLCAKPRPGVCGWNLAV